MYLEVKLGPQRVMTWKCLEETMQVLKTNLYDTTIILGKTSGGSYETTQHRNTNCLSLPQKLEFQGISLNRQFYRHQAKRIALYSYTPREILPCFVRSERFGLSEIRDLQLHS